MSNMTSIYILFYILPFYFLLLYPSKDQTPIILLTPKTTPSPFYFGGSLLRLKELQVQIWMS